MDLLSRKPVDILELFKEKQYLKICAPMVRYSKLQFRTLVRNYGCDLCFTPMMLADSFCLSEKARRNEFATNMCDSPLIAQFAGNTIQDFVGAAHLIAPYCDGVDMNCGCPQRWARQLGLGCAMLDNPELISNIIKECRNTIPKPFTISVKTRILKDLKKTVDLCKQLEKAGASFISVHARTSTQLTGDINEEVLRLIVENLDCPVVANGGVKNVDESDELYRKTKCKGVMVANGILTNPMLFSGSNTPTIECIQDWLNICYNSTIPTNDYSKSYSKSINNKPWNLTFQCFHHHLVFMLEKILPKWKRRIFNNLQTFKEVIDFLETELQLVPELYNTEKFASTTNLPLDYTGRDLEYTRLKQKFSNENKNDSILYNYEDSNGSYFNDKITQSSDDECNLNNLFIECG